MALLHHAPCLLGLLALALATAFFGCSARDLDVAQGAPGAPLPEEAEAHGQAGAARGMVPALMASGAVFVAGPVSAGGPTSYLVWGYDAEHKVVTSRIDDTGRELTAYDGARIATDDGVWAWQAEAYDVETHACDIFDDKGKSRPGDPPAKGSAVLAKLVLVNGDEEQTVVGRQTTVAQEFQHSVGLMGSVGPYIFLEDTTYEYACGAHGNTTFSSTVWDARQRNVVDLSRDVGSFESARAAALPELSDGDDDPFPPGDDIALTALEPRFEADGTFALGLQLTAPTCYACSRGGAGSYTKSAIVAAPSIPRVLVPFTTSLDAVRVFAGAHPGMTIGGVSAITDGAAP